MGIISLEKQNHLYWLGRYSERVFTTIKAFLSGYDKMLDDDAADYHAFCKYMDIPNIYKSQEDFINTYLYDEKDSNSIYANLRRAYDNAMVLRDEISSESLSYIELALDTLLVAKKQPFSLLSLQTVLDKLLAFWGSVDDYVLCEATRDILKCGRYLERLDLYIRLDRPSSQLEKEYKKFTHRLGHLSSLQYSKENFEAFDFAFKRGNALRPALKSLNAIFF